MFDSTPSLLRLFSFYFSFFFSLKPFRLFFVFFINLYHLVLVYKIRASLRKMFIDTHLTSEGGKRNIYIKSNKKKEYKRRKINSNGQSIISNDLRFTVFFSIAL